LTFFQKSFQGNRIQLTHKSILTQDQTVFNFRLKVQRQYINFWPISNPC